MLSGARKQTRARRCLFALALACVGAWPSIRAGAQPIDIPTPPGSQYFGAAVAVLPNGNFVVTDPYAQSDEVGAVYLYHPDGTLISSLTGSTAFDQVGSGGITVLANGNFVVASPAWSNGSAAAAGAVTWVNGNTGLSGAVSSENSLVGSATNDNVGSTFIYGPVFALPNGNYVVASFNWNNAAGAVTWASGSTGLSGAVSPANSVVGSTTGDNVGQYGITILSNGNYVVPSPSWNGGAGAATWVDGATGLAGPISAANSLVGSSASDSVGSPGVAEITALSNGNYVVASSSWNGGRGAVTWGDGHTGVHGFVSAGNSLIGSATTDHVGFPGATALTNGNYVVSTLDWSSDRGAVTWASGATGLIGEISAANSLVGSTAGDSVGIPYVLSNGNYVVVSRQWHGGTNNGAVTWGNGSTGATGVVSADNSLVGNESLPTPTGYDSVSIDLVPLANGNYVVSRPSWNHGAAIGAGAVTWADGTQGISGAVSTANSLVGTSSGDGVGAVTGLTNGNYVVGSPHWTNGQAANAGAVTWANGRTALTGEVSAQNSLVGLDPDDRVGTSVAVLANGNYVVMSPLWSLKVPQQIGSSLIPQIGAATWGDGIRGSAGAVSAANSLIGSHPGDQVGSYVTALSSGDYVVVSPFWANGQATAAGAVTWGNGREGSSGVVSAANSLVGSSVRDYIGGADLITFGGPPTYIAGVTALAAGSYAVVSPQWSGGGAVSLGSRGGSPIGLVTVDNSAVGKVPQGYPSLIWAYDATRDQLIVGLPDNNKVTIIKGSNSSAPALKVDQHGLTGSWYNPATGGQGIEVEMYPDLAGPGKGVLFGGWFTFDATAAGGQRWYALQGTTNDTTTITLDIATGYAGNFAAPPAVTGSIVGQAAIQFLDCNNATLTYNFSDGSGRTGSIPLTRLTANVTCAATGGDNGTAPTDYALSGSWFDSTASGQGLIFDINPIQTYLFAAWYTFAPDGALAGGPASQRWYTLQSGQFTHGTTALHGIGIYTATGGIFNDPAATTTSQVGTADIAFSDCNAMTLSYAFTSGDNQGRSGTIHLSRTGPAPEGCGL